MKTNLSKNLIGSAAVILMVIAIIFMFIQLVSAADTPACEFLEISNSAQSSAMGDAITAYSSDAESLGHNPACLGNVTSRVINVSHNQWFEGVSVGALGYAYRVSDKGVLGLGAQYLWGPQTEITTLALPTGTGESFGYNDTAIIAGYAHKINNKITLGADIKYIQETIYTAHGDAWAMDAGALYSMNNDVKFGASINNAGTSITLNGKQYKLPGAARIGVSAKPTKDLAIAADIKTGMNMNVDLLLGAEYEVCGMILLRGGYNGAFARNAGDLAGITAGLGFKAHGICFDYAWTPNGDLGYAQRITAKIYIGENK